MIISLIAEKDSFITLKILSEEITMLSPILLIFLLDKKTLKRQSSFEEMIENNTDILQW